MRIQSSQVALAAKRSYAEQYSREESFRFWVGPRRSTDGTESGTNSNTLAPPAPPPPPANAATPTRSGPGPTEAAIEADLDPLHRMMKDLLERIFGINIDLSPFGETPCYTVDQAGSVPSAPPSTESPQPLGWGMDYQVRETHAEAEQTDFAAQGVVRLDTGEEISFGYSLSMQRVSIEESSFRLQAGDAMIDPLVLNLDDTTANLTNERLAFDLDADGQAESIAFARGGSAFLALDKNGNSRIDDGSELFGPSTGNGFSELARYDSDHNSWIDENDPVFERLRLLNVDGTGNLVVKPLKTGDVGAIYLGNTETPFTVQTASQETQGQVARTGIYLKVHGGAGSVQQVDLVA